MEDYCDVMTPIAYLVQSFDICDYATDPFDFDR